MTLSTAIRALVFWSAKKMPILSSRAIVLVWALRPGWEVPVYQMSPPTMSKHLLSPEGENKRTYDVSELLWKSLSTLESKSASCSPCFLLISCPWTLLCCLFSFSLQGSPYLDSCWISCSRSHPAPVLWRAHGTSAVCAGSTQPHWKASICAQHAVQTQGCWLCR